VRIMNIGFTEEQEMLRKTVKSFAEREVAPLAYEIDRDECFPEKNFKKLLDLELLGITAPLEYGGANTNYTEACIVMEELAVARAPTPPVSFNVTLFPSAIRNPQL
jgi:alkylation response protein AidB-like acyl-CoA dehydrogenase